MQNFEKFKNKVLNYIAKKMHFSLFRGAEADEFIEKTCLNISILTNQKRMDGCKPYENEFITKSGIYKALLNADESNFLNYINALLNLKIPKQENIVDFHKYLMKVIEITGYNLHIIKTDNVYEFQNLANDNVTKSLFEENNSGLRKCSLAHKSYTEAIEKYNSGKYYRNILDDLRHSLESLLKEMLNNSKPIEKQTSDLGNYLKTKKSGSEIRALFTTLMTYFSKYQNAYVKHDNKIQKTEVDFIFHLYLAFTNYLIKIE